jgi:hypothetical protein
MAIDSALEFHPGREGNGHFSKRHPSSSNGQQKKGKRRVGGTRPTSAGHEKSLAVFYATSSRDEQLKRRWLTQQAFNIQ